MTRQTVTAGHPNDLPGKSVTFCSRCVIRVCVGFCRDVGSSSRWRLAVEAMTIYPRYKKAANYLFIVSGFKQNLPTALNAPRHLSVSNLLNVSSILRKKIVECNLVWSSLREPDWRTRLFPRGWIWGWIWFPFLFLCNTGTCDYDDMSE